MATITKQFFGEHSSGQKVDLYTLSNGITEVEILSFGAAIRSIRTPDANGEIADVVCGRETMADYEKCTVYMGMVIGRNANRIGGAKFLLNGKEYQLSANNGPNNLHGGPNGFDAKIWEMEIVGEEGHQHLVCRYFSKDMENGFPGNLNVTVTYSLSDDHALTIDYHAVSDADTIVNLTNHSYFNLAGHDSGPAYYHKLKLHSDFYTPSDEFLAPTGEVLSVHGTPLDFTQWKEIKAGMDELGSGFDHNYLLNVRENQMTLAAEVLDEASGRKMEVYTNKPAVQFYTGHSMKASLGKNDAKYVPCSGLCLETQITPNSLAHPHLGNPILRKGEVYHDQTVYKFMTVK